MANTRTAESRELGEVSNASEELGFKEAKEEAIKLTWLALPLMLANMMNYVITAVTLSYAGSLRGKDSGSLAIGACALAFSIQNVTGNSLACGLLLPLDTLCSQAYGAKQYERLGHCMQRGLFISSIVITMSSILWVNAEKVLLAMGQSAELSRVTARFMVWLIPGIWAFMFTFAMRRFLVSQKVTKIFPFISAVFVGSHVLATWALVSKFQKGLDGAAAAVSISNSVQMFLTMIYLAYHMKTSEHGGKCWQFDWRETFKGWGEYLKLALPACAQLFSKWWMFELVIILSGILPPKHTAKSHAYVASMGVSNNIDALLFYLCLGVAFATNSTVGNHLGAGDWRRAKLAGKMALVVNFILWVFCAILLLEPQLQKLFIEMYAGDHEKSTEVRALLKHMMVYIVILQLADGSKEMLNSVLTATARQRAGAITAGISYNGIGLPAVLLLAFHGKSWYGGVYGLWLGLVIATYSVLGLNLIAVGMTKWEREAEKARERSGARQAEAAAPSDSVEDGTLQTPLLDGNE